MRGLWILLLAGLPAYAGIHQFDDKTVHLKLGVDMPGYDIKFKSLESAEEVTFKPNVFSLFSVGASLQGWLGGAYGFRTTQTEKDKTQKGETTYEDWRFNFAFPKFHISVDYSQFKGFYVEKTDAIDPAWTSDQPYYQTPMKSLTTGANFTWIFSPADFSFEAAYDQTSRQEADGGSWLAGASVRRTVFSNDEEIIPTALQQFYGDQKHITEGQFDSVTIKGGYGYGLVWAKKYFLSSALQIGFGGQQMRIKGTDFSTSRWSNAKKIDAVISTGYNGDAAFGGIRLLADATMYDTGNIEITSTLWGVSLFLGIRL